MMSRVDLGDYTRAAEEYTKGNCAHGYLLLQAALKAEIPPAKRSLSRDDLYARAVETNGILSGMAEQNSEYALRLCRQGRWSDAKGALAANLALAGRIADSDPTDRFVMFLGGVAVWKSSMRLLARMARQQGDTQLASCVCAKLKRGEAIYASTICPLMASALKASTPNAEAKAVAQVRRVWSQKVGWSIVRGCDSSQP